jgi:hypothetical protein
VLKQLDLDQYLVRFVSLPFDGVCTRTDLIELAAVLRRRILKVSNGEEEEGRSGSCDQEVATSVVVLLL